MYLSLVGLFLTTKLGSVLGAPVDPFSPVENVAFAVVDAVANSASGGGDEAKEKAN